MAKGNSKGYSAGGGKKWLIAIALVVLVAIVVVVVLICIPPNTYNAIQTLHRTTQSSFLAESSKEQDDIIDLRNKLETGTKFQIYIDELNDMTNISFTIFDVLNFYDGQLVFASDNKNLKKNFKPIKNNLNEAKEIQRNLASSLDKMRDIARDTDSMRNAFIDFRSNYIKWLKANQKAIKALNSAYTGSMGNLLENNLASRHILNTIDEMLNEVIERFEKTKEIDKKGSELKTDYYQSGAISLVFERFVLKNLIGGADISPIKDYYFNENVQDVFGKFDKFFKVYKLDNLSPVLSSINDQAEFTKTFEGVEDTEGLYETVKKILGGAEW